LARNTKKGVKDEKKKNASRQYGDIIRRLQRARDPGSSHASYTGCDISAIREMEAVVMVLRNTYCRRSPGQSFVVQ
jgi:hypothetical protein